MMRQKAERVRQHKEEEKRMKEEEEARKRHLEELYNKQKHASQMSAAAGKKEKNRQRQNFEAMHGISLNDMPKHSHLTERARFLVSFFNPMPAEFLKWNNTPFIFGMSIMIFREIKMRTKLVSQQYRAWSDCMDVQIGLAL